jgi:hypothetical protein
MYIYIYIYIYHICLYVCTHQAKHTFAYKSLQIQRVNVELNGPDVSLSHMLGYYKTKLPLRDPMFGCFSDGITHSYGVCTFSAKGATTQANTKKSKEAAEKLEKKRITAKDVRRDAVEGLRRHQQKNDEGTPIDIPWCSM